MMVEGIFRRKEVVAALRLSAVRPEGRHALGSAIQGLTPDGLYRVVVWVKNPLGANAMIQIRDSVSGDTGQPSNYGVAAFDLTNSSVLRSSEQLLDTGIASDRDDWKKLSVDLRSHDGRLFFVLGLLEKGSNIHVFRGLGQQLTFGGVDVIPLSPGAVRPSAAMPASSNAELAALPKTGLAELPRLPGTAEWDLIVGLNATVAEGRPSVVAEQPVLHLAAVSPDERHALAARFRDLVPGGVYRMMVWVKPGSGANVQLEVRDSVDPQTTRPINEGEVRFDLASKKVLTADGNLVAHGIEEAPDHWRKLWVDVKTADGQVFVSVGMLEGGSNSHMFRATRQQLELGGFELAPK